jgi:hypothetical protein
MKVAVSPYLAGGISHRVASRGTISPSRAEVQETAHKDNRSQAASRHASSPSHRSHNGDNHSVHNRSHRNHNPRSHSLHGAKKRITAIAEVAATPAHHQSVQEDGGNNKLENKTRKAILSKGGFTLYGSCEKDTFLPSMKQ